jgi:hypothetical protein
MHILMSSPSDNFLMECMNVVDNIAVVTELKKDAMLVMVSKKEKEVFKKAAGLDDRGLSDWIRWLARNRAREHGLSLTADEGGKPKKKQ